MQTRSFVRLMLLLLFGVLFVVHPIHLSVAETPGTGEEGEPPPPEPIDPCEYQGITTFIPLECLALKTAKVWSGPAGLDPSKGTHTLNVTVVELASELKLGGICTKYLMIPNKALNAPYVYAAAVKSREMNVPFQFCIHESTELDLAASGGSPAGGSFPPNLKNAWWIHRATAP